MSNNRKSGGYDYISDKEWISANRVGNFRVLDAISDKKNVDNNNHTNETLGELNVGSIGRIDTHNSNRDKINGILRSEESSLIIKDLIKMKDNLGEQSENIEKILNKHLDVRAYNEFLKDPSNYNEKFIFKNITVGGDIPKNLSGLIDYGKKVMTALPKTHSADLVRNIEKNKEYIEYSISSAMSWKYVNLNRHSIGTPTDIMNFAVIMYNNYGKEISIFDLKKLKFIGEVYGSYLGNKFDEFLNNLRLPGLNIDSVPMITYDTTSSKDNILLKKQDGINITNNIESALKMAESRDVGDQGDKIGIAREYLVVLVFELMAQLIKNLYLISKTFKDYVGKYKAQHKNIDINIEIFNKLIDNAINIYFKLDNRELSAYGIDPASPDKRAQISFDDTSILRVIGGWDRIKGFDKFSEHTYPLKGDDGEMVKKLVAMIDTAPEKDMVDGSSLAMGGFIQNDFIGKMSMKITHDYFEELIKNKDLNEKYIITILNKMRKGVHMKDLQIMRTDIETKFKNIGKTDDKTTKTLSAKAAAQALAKEYKRYRNYELDNLLSLDMIETTIKTNPEKAASVAKKIVQLRDESLAKFGHYQLKSHAFKTLTLGGYRQLMNVHKRTPNMYPSEYLGLIQEAFTKVDNEILKELAGKSKGKYEVLKERMMTKIVNRNIISPSTSTVTATGNSETNIVNYNTELSAYNWKDIESKDFWMKVKQRLDGLTVYIPYVNISVAELGHQHGLFDLINAAIEGKIIESLVIGSASNHIIAGSKLDKATISRRIRAQGTIMVANGDSEIRDIGKWRCMVKKDITDMKKLGAADLRRKIFNILSKKAQYQMDTPYIWPNNSYTKEKIVLYCKMIHGKDLHKCALLSSRNRIASKIQ
jgi:hypothetical protein